MELSANSPEVFESWETQTWCGVHISVMNYDDPLPSNSDAQRAIETVQGELAVSLQDLHSEWHHSTQEGFEFDEKKAQEWLAASQAILWKAYSGLVPDSAFVCGY